MGQTAVIIPFYNEASRFDAEAYRRFVDEYSDRVRLYFVDDGSTDATRQFLQEFVEQSDGQVVLVPLAVNQGKAEAVRQGTLLALDAEEGPFDWVGYWDADLATPLEEIPRFLEHLEGRDDIQLLCGSRWLHMGVDIRRRTLRHYTGRFFATMASTALQMPFYDTQCGAKLMRPDLARQLFKEPLLSRWFFDVEIIARMSSILGHEEAMRGIEEIPVVSWLDRPGSKLKVTDFLIAPVDVLRIYFRYMRAGKSEK